MACAHQLDDIGVGQQQAIATNFYTHLTWPVCFGQATSAKGRQHRQGDIGRGLLAKVVAYAHHSAIVERCLHTTVD